jgi:geranylgeranyl reductase family protein
VDIHVKTEVAVLGGGPAGLIAAEFISSKGFNVQVFEEHEQIGYPVHCAGVVSIEGFKRLGIKIDPVFHRNTVYGGRIFSSNGSCLSIRDKIPRAYIIDRGPFDNYLSEKALNRNVEININKRVEQIKFQNGFAKRIFVDGKDISSDLFIDAEGARGRLLSRSGIETGQKGVLSGFNVELNDVCIEPNIVEVWLNQEIAKDFFVWVIPLGEDKVRCGLATSNDNGVKALKKFIKRRFKIQAPRIIQGGLVCTGGPILKTVFPGLMLVGDVAGHVKPTTAGGIIIGGLCAKIAGETAVNALQIDDFSLGSLKEYENTWKNRYGSELQIMLLLRRLLNKLEDDRINQIFKVFIKEGLETKFTKLVEDGDMDMQAEIIRRAVTDPVILTALVKSLGRLAVSDLFTVFGF